MAINSTTRQTTAYTTGNNFAFAFKVFTTADVKVIKIQTSNGAETVLNLNSDYTVTLNGDQDNNPGGSVTLSSGSLGSGSLVGFNIVITSKIEAKQLTELTNQGGFFPSVINNALDKSVILHQQQQNVIDKTIRFRQTDGITGLEITDGASTRATKTISFDSNGNVTLIGPVVTTGDTGTITTNMIGDDQVTPAKIGNADLKNLSSCQTGGSAALSDLTQAEVQILHGATVSTTELNKIDGLTAVASDLNKLNGMTATTENLSALTGITAVETSVTTNSNTKIPTSKAVNDLVLSVTNALGGFVAIANATSFPTSHPDPSENAGTVVSITDANGIVVNSSGVATIPAGAGQDQNGNNIDVTINGFPTDLRSKTLGSGIGLQVQTTTTLHTYDYHKALVKESDLINLSNDIDDFKNRYRVVSTTPTSDNDEGDIIYRTSDNKLLIYNGTAFQDPLVGNFYINTLSSYNGTGGNSATFNGSAYRFNINHAPEKAEQLLVSINGVIQKPNSGTSQPTGDGFALDGDSILFGAAPASGSDFFIITIGKSVNIGVVSDGSIDNAKVASNASIEGTKINPNFGSQNISTTGTVGGVDLSTYQADGGSYLRSDADDSFTGTLTGVSDTVNPVIQINGSGPNFIRFDSGVNTPSDSIDLVYRTTPNTLAFERVSDSQIMFSVDADDQQAIFNGNVDCNSGLDVTGQIVSESTTGTGSTGLKIANSNESFVQYFEGGGADATFVMSYTGSGGTDIRFKHNGEIQLNNAGQEKFKTTSTGVDVTGNIEVSGSGTFDSGLTVKDASGSDPSMQINHSDADVTGEFLRIGRTDLGTRYHSLKAKHGGAATANLLSFNLHNGSTTTSQTEVLKLNGDGSVDFAGNLTLPDNGKIILGNDGETDSFISFNGTNLLIKETSPTGSLRLTGHNVFLTNPSQNDETYLKCNGQSTDRNVELYCQGTQRLETTSTGIKVDRIVTIDGSTPRIEMKVTADEQSHRIEFYNAADSIVSRIYGHPSGDLELQTGSNGNESAIKVNSNGAVDLHFDGGTYSTPKLSTVSNGVKVDGKLGIGTSSPNRSLHIVSNGTSKIALTDSDITAETNSLVGGIDFTTLDTQNAGISAHIGAYHQDDQGNAYLRFDTGNASNVTERMRIKSDGAVELTETLKLQNNKNLNLGGSNNLVLKFDGSVARILADSQPMYLKGLNGSATQAGITMYKGNSSEKMFEAFNDGSVKLYYDAGTSGSPKLSTSASGIGVTGTVEATANLRNSVPSDFWNSGTHIEVGDLGHLSTHGGFEFTLTSGGYRRQVGGVGKWKDIAVDGVGGFGCQVALAPKTGKIHLRSNSGLSTDDNNPSGAGLADRLVVDQTGVDITGDVVATGDGTFHDIRVGEWTANATFAAVQHKNQTGNEYMLLSKDDHTYISASNGHSVYIRGGNNSQTNQIQVHPSGGVSITAANNVNILDGNIDFGSNADNNPVISMKDDNNRTKYRVYTNSDFGMGFSGNITHGGLNGHCVTFQVSNNSNRGWLFLNSGQTLDKGAMALTADGKMSVTHSMRLGYGESDTTTPGATYALDVSGSAIISSSLTAGGLTFPTVNGNDGQVLTSDGAGNVQWEDATGGGSTFNGGTIQNELVIDPTGNTHPKLRFVPSSGRHFFFEQDAAGLKLMNQTADGSTQTIFWRFETGENEIYQSLMHRKTADFTFSSVYPHINAKAAHNRNKINLYSGFNFQIGTENITYGGLNSSAITFSCTNNDSAGFIFTSPGHGSNDGAMAITANGKVTIAHSLRLGYGTDDDTTTPGATHALDVSGSISSTSTISATTSNASSSNNIRKITTSTSQPSGGADGDIWIVVPS